MQLPDPFGLSWHQWATTAAGFNPSFGQYVNPDLDWPKYANSLTYLLPMTPRPDMFATWQDWAKALKLAVSS